MAKFGWSGKVIDGYGGGRAIPMSGDLEATTEKEALAEARELFEDDYGTSVTDVRVHRKD